MNRKGFTLTELLVVIVILGIIAGLTIPLIRGLSDTFEKKKYTSYKDSMLTSGKLYNDSYGEDLFGHNEYGCAYIPYEKLVERNLIKDIDVSDVTCNSSKTYVRVVKQKDKYGYQAFLTCGKEENGTLKEVTVSLPEVVPEMDPSSCNGSSYTLAVSVDDSQIGNTYDKMRKKTKVKISSYTGIDNNIVIYTKWSQDRNDHSNTGFTKTNFKVGGDQEAILLEGNPVTSNSKELVTPEGAEGQWYLIVRVDHLQDLYGHNWKNPDNTENKYLSFGPFSVDNTDPTIVANVYKCNSEHKKTGSVLTTKTVTSGDGVLTISGITGLNNGWVNNINYPYGLCFEFNIADNRSLKYAEWKWNETGFTANASGYNTFNGGLTPKDYSGETSQVFTSYFAGSGHRYGQFTVKDYVGHATTLVIDVKVDRDKPVCGNNNGSTSWTKSDRTINQECSDAISGCTQSSFSKKFTTTTKVGSLEIVDNAGNKETCGPNVYIDKTAPTCGSDNGSTSWTKSDRTVKQNCSDSHSGCTQSSFSKKFDSSRKTGTITIKDNVGNTKDCTVNVYVDQTDPSCGTVKATTNNSSSGISGTVACSDSHSGCTSSTFGYNKRTSTGTVTIKDKVGNTKDCTVKVKSYDCGSWSAWKFVKMLEDTTQNNCKYNGVWTGSTKKREYLNCATGNLPSNGVCGGSNRCGSCTGSTCHRGCCIEQDWNSKTCYKLNN